MKSRTIIKIVLALVIVGGVAALYFSPLRSYLDRGHIHQTVDQLRTLWYGPLALIVAYAVGCVFVLPATIFVVAAGVIWGWKLGTVYALVGAMLGASMSYFVGRFLGEGMLERFGKPGQAVKAQLERAGFLSMLIARLIPGPPFAVWNYGAGVARMRFSDYFFATLLGTLPAHLVFAYSADAIFNGTMSEGDALKRLVLVALLLLAIVLIPSLVKKRMDARRAAG
jgi:uncharacterized membrane protein YdjX (TVP38/TMEM64 family)